MHEAASAARWSIDDIDQYNTTDHQQRRVRMTLAAFGKTVNLPQMKTAKVSVVCWAMTIPETIRAKIATAVPGCGLAGAVAVMGHSSRKRCGTR